MSGYESLDVYKKAYKAALEVYEMSRGFPQEERYAMTNQIRRAATSISLCIAEGYGKKSSQREFKRFLEMAMGSSNEVSVLLDFSKDLGYIPEERYVKEKREYEEIGRMINGLLRRVEREVQNLKSSV